MSSKGYSLIEIMVSVTILGLLAGIAVPKFQGYVEKARIARCIAEIRYFEKEIFTYYIVNEKYPETIANLGRSKISLLDPWGNPYKYFLIAGTKWAKNDGGGGTYYAKSNKTPDFVTIVPENEQGFWGSSWFVSEAWADQPADPGNSGSPPGQSGTPPGQSGDPGNSGNAGGGGNAGGNSGNAGGGNAGGNSGNAGGGGPPSDEQKKPRQDRFLKPVSSDYDLYSMGVDGETKENLNAKQSLDDIVRASDGAYVGLAENF